MSESCGNGSSRSCRRADFCTRAAAGPQLLFLLHLNDAAHHGRSSPFLHEKETQMFENSKTVFEICIKSIAMGTNWVDKVEVDVIMRASGVSVGK